MVEQLEVGDYVVRLFMKTSTGWLGSPAKIVAHDPHVYGKYEIKIHRERLIRSVWRDELEPVTEQDYFLMCMKYEPSPFYKED